MYSIYIPTAVRGNDILCARKVCLEALEEKRARPSKRVKCLVGSRRVPRVVWRVRPVARYFNICERIRHWFACGFGISEGMHRQIWQKGRGVKGQVQKDSAQGRSATRIRVQKCLLQSEFRRPRGAWLALLSSCSDFNLQRAEISLVSLGNKRFFHVFSRHPLNNL